MFQRMIVAGILITVDTTLNLCLATEMEFLAIPAINGHKKRQYVNSILPTS